MTGKPPAIGSNSNLTEKEKQGLRFHHYRACKRAQEAVDDAIAERKKVRGRAKAEGIMLADIDYMMRCANIEDSSIIVDELKRRLVIAEEFALLKQADLFTDFDDAYQRIEREGEKAGLAGEDHYDHDYAAGSPEAQAFERGWDRGQKTMREDLATALEKAKAEDDGESEDEDDQEAGSAPGSESGAGSGATGTEEDDRDLRPRFMRDQDNADA